MEKLNIPPLEDQHLKTITIIHDAQSETKEVEVISLLPQPIGNDPYADFFLEYDMTLGIKNEIAYSDDIYYDHAAESFLPNKAKLLQLKKH